MTVPVSQFQEIDEKLLFFSLRYLHVNNDDFCSNFFFYLILSICLILMCLTNVGVNKKHKKPSHCTLVFQKNLQFPLEM